MSMPQTTSDDGPVAAPIVIPSLELTGSPGDRLQTLDASIAQLQKLRCSIVGDASPEPRPHELYGPYLHAPVWPWFVAGWVIGALFVLMFVFARVLA
jgi:hypothetical protein